MAASDILDNIESTVKVKRIKDINQRSLWPLLRQKIVFHEVKKSLGLDNKLRTRSKRQLAINFFYGLPKLFRLKKYEFVFFNNSDKRILLNNAYYDIFFDAWADILSQDKSLFVEWAIDRHTKQERLHSKNVISDLPFKFFISIVSIFVRPSIQNETLLDEIIKTYTLPIGLKKELKSKLAELYVFKFIFRVIKPKAIFVLSSFTKVGIVMAAKELGIKVFEAQHGYIGDSHTFYSATIHFKEAYPDYLLSFGTYEKHKANDRLIFTPNQILPVGSLRLELLKNHPSPEALLTLKKKYIFIFCVTMQALMEDELLGWISKEAEIHKDWLFILRPKNDDNSYSDYKRENIVQLDEYSIYDILKVSDYNITIYSTTAIEGLFLDADPIFYNIQNLSKNHFNTERMNAIVVEEGQMLAPEFWTKKPNKKHTFFVENYFKNVENTELNF